MLLTTHITTSLLFCQDVHNPFLAFVIGLGSHYLLDMIPHGDNLRGKRYLLEDVHLFKEHPEDNHYLKILAPLDIVVSTCLVIYLLVTHQLGDLRAAGPAIAGAILPDAINLINIITNKYNWVKKANRLHLKIHLIFPDVPLVFTLSGQIIYNTVLLYILYFSQHGF